MQLSQRLFRSTVGAGLPAIFLVILVAFSAAFAQSNESSALVATTAAPEFAWKATSPRAAGQRKATQAAAEVRFEPNRGQASPSTRFVAHASGYDVNIAAEALTFSIPKTGAPREREQVALRLSGADPTASYIASEPLPGSAHFLLDSTHWIKDVPAFGRLQFNNVYRGVDLQFHGNGARLEYDFHVAAKANPEQIRWLFAPDAQVQETKTGALTVTRSDAQFTIEPPVAYQSNYGMRDEVPASYRLRRTPHGTEVSLRLGAYDRSRALIIDPVVTYSVRPATIYYAGAMTADTLGNVYLVSNSGALQITKVGPDGSTVVYNTNLGSSSTYVTDVAVDGSGQLYIVGYSYSGLPTTTNAYQQVAGGTYHAFLTVLNSNGSGLVYSSYLAGSSYDVAVGVAVDGAGKVLLTGYTDSVDFPNTGTTFLTGGYQAAFVARIDPTLSSTASLLYSNILNSSYQVQGVRVRGDAAGNAYVLFQGNTMTPTPGAFAYDGTYSGSGGVYVGKFDATGATTYLAYLGYGTGYDLAVDGSGNSYVVGTTSFADFPVTTNGYQTTFSGSFLSELDATGSTLKYGTFLNGPSGNTTPTSVALPPGCSSNCVITVGGFTSAQDFPTTNAVQSSLAGASDAFVTQLKDDGTAPTFSTYLGGADNEDVNSGSNTHLPQVAVDSKGNVYIAGDTYSSDYPLTGGPASNYTFLTRISPTATGVVIPDEYGVDFSSQTTGVASPAKPLRLRNYGSVAVNITSIVASSSFGESDDCGGVIAAGGFCTLQLTFTPPYAGYKSGTLTVNYGSNSQTVIALSGTGQDQPLLTVTPAAWTFGTQAVGSTSPATNFTVTNIGNQPAPIYGVSTYYGNTDAFVATTNCPTSLPAGASCTVSVVFAPYTVGYFGSYLYVSAGSSFTNGTSTFPLNGTGLGVGTAALNYSSTSYVFPDQAVGSTSNQQYLSVTNTGTIPVVPGATNVTGDFSVQSYCTSQLLPGESCTIYLYFSPKATGARTGTLSLVNTAEATPTTISLSGNGIADVQGLVISTPSLAYADQVVGTSSADQQITLTNYGTAPVIVSRIFDTSDDFKISYDSCVTTLAPQGGSCTFSVRFTPTTTGARSASVIVEDSAPGSPQTVSVSGNGVASTESVLLSPGNAVFDDTVVGQPGPTQYFYVYNAGNTNVSVSSVTSTSGDFAITYNSCSTIYAGNSCEVDVQFRPTAAGVRNGSLVMADSAAGSPHVAALTGNGLTASSGLIPTPLSAGFPDTVVGSASSSQYLYFYNPGNTIVNVSSVAASGDFNITYQSCNQVYPQSSCEVDVQFQPTATGVRTGILSVIDDASGSPHTLQLSGNGVSAFTEIVPTPASVGFTDQVVGTTSSSTTVYFYNPGNTAVSVSSVVAGGDFAMSYDGCSAQTIGAGSYCFVYVTFTPTAPGARTATLTMTDSASGSPHGVTLSGNGVAASQQLTLTPASIDFGNLGTSTLAPGQTLYLTNTGTQPVTVTNVGATAPFTATANCLVTLNPNQTCGVTVGLTTPGTAGPQSGSVTITSNASGSPQSTAVAGNAVSTTPTFLFSPNGLQFPMYRVGTTSGALSVNFKNQSGTTLTVSGASANGDFAVASNNCTALANGASCTVTVTFAPTATGNRTGTLTLTHNGPGGSSSINLAGLGQASTQTAVLSATALGFVDQVIGTISSTQNVTFTNTGTAPITVSSLVAAGDFNITGQNCTGSAVPAGSSCGVNVNFQPTTAGTRSGTLTFTSSDAGSPHVVTLSGNGVTGSKSVALSTTAIQFSDEPVGTTSGSEYVQLYNTGNQTINLASVVLQGDFAMTNYCGTTLSAGSSCVVYLSFKPTATGTRTGSLVFTDDASASPQSVALSGNGLTAVKSLLVSATVLNFPDQPLTTTGNTVPITIENNGNVAVLITGSSSNSADFVLSYNYCPTNGLLQAHSSCGMYLQFQPTATGTRSGTLTIGNDTPAGNLTVSLSGNGVTAVHTARLSATALTFADQAVGTTGPGQYVTLFNTGNVPLQLTSAIITGDYSPTSYNYCYANSTISAGSYCYLYVAFTPTGTGTRAGAITFTDDAGGGTQTVTLTGNGLNPTSSLSLSPANISFVPQSVGTTSNTQYVTLTNTGNTPVTFTGINLTGANTGDFTLSYNGCSGAGELSTYGGVCSLGVTFNPVATGTRAATLTITDSASGSPHQVALSGTGLAAAGAVQLSQTSVNFPTVAVGSSSSTVAVYYVNQGSTTVNIASVTPPSTDYNVSGCITPGPVYPNSNCILYVQFHPSATGPRNNSIVITDDAPGSPRTVSLFGTGAAPYGVASLSTAALAFGNQTQQVTSPSQSVVINNTGTGTLNLSSVAVTGGISDYTAQNNCPTSLTSGQTCSISVSFTPSTTGLRNGTLTISDDSGGSASQQTVALSGSGVSSSPAATLNYAAGVNFGYVGIGVTSSPVTVTLSNTGTAPMTIAGISAPLPFAAATNANTPCGATLAVNAYCYIDVTFTPTASGQANATLAITDNAPGSPHQVSLVGTGTSSPALSITPSSLIFGNQQVNVASSPLPVTVINQGSTATFSNVTASPDFAVSSNGCTGQLATGAGCTVSVTFTPTAMGPRTGTLTFTDDAANNPQTIPLSGTGIGSPVVQLSATSLSFADQNVATTSASQTVTLTNTGTGPLAMSSISTASGDFKITGNTCGTSVNTGASCTFSVAFTPTTYGARSDSVSISDSASNSPQTVSLGGNGLGATATLPTGPISFGTVAVGANAPQSISLTNQGNVPLTVNSVTLANGTNFSQSTLCIGSLPAATSCNLNVTFAPTAAGTLSDTLIVITSVGSQGLTVTGTGTGPVASLTASSLSFGSVNVGTTSPAQNITLTSSGDTALTISGISASGDFSQTNNCPASLSANCTIAVTFHPTATGPRTGGLTISDNTASSPHQISLSGTGLGATVTLNPSNLDFGNSPVGTAAPTQSFSVTNSGTATLFITAIAATGDYSQTNNCTSSLLPGAFCTVTVTFTPVASGTRPGAVSVTSNAPTQSASLTGVGVGPQVQLSQSSLNFGSQQVNLASSPQSVLLTNSGNSTLTISSVGLTGSNPGDFLISSNNCPSQLTAGSFCTIGVTFTPTATGTRSAALSLTDDAPGSPQSVSLNGTGVTAQADLVVTGNNSAGSVAPGGIVTTTINVTNAGPAPATSVTLTITPPSSGTINTITPSGIECTGTAPITCVTGSLPVNGQVSVSLSSTAAGTGNLVVSATATANEADPNATNNSISLTTAVVAADIQLVPASSAGSQGGLPTFSIGVVNNGPASATFVNVSCALNRFTYVNATTTQGTCSESNGTMSCSVGSMTPSAVVTLTAQVQPPTSGWASIACQASSETFDPNPVNNKANLQPGTQGNTSTGSNVAVQVGDAQSGATAQVSFTSVTVPGSTSLVASPGATPPSAFRSGTPAWTFDVSTSAAFTGPVTVTFALPAGQFHHPDRVRLFHMEGGIWRDRTVANNGATVSAVTTSLSPFALFEPVNHAPIAGAGSDRGVSGASMSGAAVALDGSGSSDADGDALTYRWTGPFPEGNGVVTGVHPTVTLPFGSSAVTLVVNDGEADSAPATVNVAVSDFAVAVSGSAASLSLQRGQSGSVNVLLTSKNGSYDQPVTLGCANLPANMTCTFSPASLQPGANGGSSTLTLTSSPLASLAPRKSHSQPFTGFGLLGISAMVWVAGDRRRRWKVLLLVVLALAIVAVGCGGGGMAVNSTTPQATPSTAPTTVTFSVTATAGGLQHSTPINVTLK